MTEPAAKKKMVGGAGCGCSGSTGPGDAWWLTAPIQMVAQWNPILALARARRVPFAPWVLPLSATFTDSTEVIPSVALDNGQGRVDQITIVDTVRYTIDRPTAFEGSIFKAQSDYFFAMQSGIQVTLNVDGAPRYGVVPTFTPIKDALEMVGERWMKGWILTYNQSIRMAFQQTIPLPFFPTTITCSFRMWQGVGAEWLVNMTTTAAWDELARLYADDAEMMAALDFARNSPVAY